MASFQINRGLESNLPQEIIDGKIYFCTDTGNLFIDYESSRIHVNANKAQILTYYDEESGQNVDISAKDLLEAANPHVILYTPQTLTKEEQIQVQENIGLDKAITDTLIDLDLISVLSEDDEEILVQDDEAILMVKDDSDIPDWNQNDRTADNYIKNRTHWEEKKESVWLEEITLTDPAQWDEGVYAFYDLCSQELVIGQKYNVVWNGTTYTDLICFDDEGYPILGDFSEYHFCLWTDFDYDNNQSYFILCTDSVEPVQTISVTTYQTTVHKIDPKFLPDHIQSDWNENDPEADGYIVNRPFYEAYMPDEELLPEQTVEITDLYTDVSDALTFVEGETYFVTLNGELYKCVAWAGTDDAICIGNGNICSDVPGGNNEPFFFHSYDDGWCYLATLRPGTHTIKIQSSTLAVVKKIDKKFLPNDIGSVKSVNGATPDETGNISIDIPEPIEPPVTSVNGMTGDVVIEAGSSAQPDWSQNDPDASGYVKNRTHYTIAEGFEVTWDGDTSNTDTFVMMSVEGIELPLYHISDEIPSNDDLENCILKISMANQNGEVISTDTAPVGEMWESFVQGGFITEKFAYMLQVAVVREENTIINGVTFPKIGTYFLYMNMGEQGIGYITELSKPSDVVKLDEVYLPDSIVGHHGSGMGAEIFNDYVNNDAHGMYSHAEGYDSSAGNYAHAEGYSSIASGDASHAEGRDTYANGNYAHTEGIATQAYGKASHAEGGTNSGGFHVSAIGDFSHAEGRITTAIGNSSHSGGTATSAFGESSNATGHYTTAYGNYSRAENKNTFAYGSSSHAEGSGVFVNMRLFNVEAGVTSHSYTDSWVLIYSGANRNSTLEACVGGYAIPEMSLLSKVDKDKYKDLILKIVAIDTVNKTITFDKPFSSEQVDRVDIALNLYGSGAYGVSSHVEGSNTIAAGRDQHVQGKYNIADTENRYAHIVGNGDTVYDSNNYVYHTNRSNAHTVDWDGNAWFAGDVYVGGTSQDNGERLARISDISDTVSRVFDLEEITGKIVYVKWNVNGEYEFAPNPAGDALVKLSDEVPSMDSIVGATFAVTITQNGETKTETKLITSDIVVETDYGYILGYVESGGFYFITAESAVIAETTLTKGVWCQNLAKVNSFIDFRIYNNPATPKITTAKVGQTIVVKAVDENGKPTEWEAVDFVSTDLSNYYTKDEIDALLTTKINEVDTIIG